VRFFPGPCRASGTRTVRGLEALALSLPPTPGHSVVKRPNNENLYSIGEEFAAAGYEPLYLYSGYGYFDNMEHFFGSNGYTVVDRKAIPKADIHYENIWGVAVGAVKYTDWAIGDFINRARERPGFDDTLFVIVADHCAAARGKADPPLDRFHIPLLIYAPKHVAPARAWSTSGRVRKSRRASRPATSRRRRSATTRAPAMRSAAARCGGPAG